MYFNYTHIVRYGWILFSSEKSIIEYGFVQDTSLKVIVASCQCPLFHAYAEKGGYMRHSCEKCFVFMKHAALLVCHGSMQHDACTCP